jgi:hypothetical protein
MVCSTGSPTQNSDFTETDINSQAALTIVPYSATNNDLPCNNLLHIQVTYSKSVMYESDVFALISYVSGKTELMNSSQ